MSEYIFKPRCTDDFELDERDATNPVDWYGTLHGEIVRCRDCVHCREHNMRAYGGRRDQLLCHHFSMSSGAGWPVEPDGFCAWGERRDA